MSAQRNRTVVWGRQVLIGLAIVVGSVIVVGQSITVPNTFVNGTVADANQVNSNFAALASNALNRNAGTMLGTLSSQAVTPTSDATYDLGTGAFRFRDGFFSRDLAVGGNGTITGTLGVTSTSTFTGAATFSSANNSFKAGGSSATHKGAGVINTDFTPASNVTSAGANDTLFTYTLPASALNANGRVVRVTVYGTFGATANTKSIRIWWNGTGGTNFVTHSSASNGTKWVIVAHVMRTGSNAQDLWGFLPMSGAAQDINAAYTTAAVTDTNAINIVVTGSSAGAANDVNYKGSIVEFLN